MSDARKWRELGFSEKTKLSLSIFLMVSSVILGFISFFILKTVPGSVIGVSGLWCSTGLALLGISSYFNNELVKMKNEVKSKINELDVYESRMKEKEE